MKLTPQAQQQIEELSWKYLDEVIEAEEFGCLEAQLRESEDARRMYVDCALLHGLLVNHYRRPGSDAAPRLSADPFLTELLDQKVDAPQEPDFSADPEPDQPASNG